MVERGARVILVRPAPVPGFRGPRSFALPEFDPFWKRVVELDVLVAMHSSDSGYARYAQEWEGNRHGDAAVPDQRVQDDQRVAPGPRRGGLVGVPRRAVPVPGAEDRGHRERLGLAAAACSTSWPTSTRRRRRASPQRPGGGAQANRIHISPFWEEDLQATVRPVGVERVLFGSDYPHPEGLAEPARYINALTGLRGPIRPRSWAATSPGWSRREQSRAWRPSADGAEHGRPFRRCRGDRGRRRCA